MAGTLSVADNETTLLLSSLAAGVPDDLVTIRVADGSHRRLRSPAAVRIGEETLALANVVSSSSGVTSRLETDHTTLSAPATTTGTTLTVVDTTEFVVQEGVTLTARIGANYNAPVETVTVVGVPNATTLTVAARSGTAHASGEKVWWPLREAWQVTRGADGTPAQAQSRLSVVGRLASSGDFRYSSELDAAPAYLVLETSEAYIGRVRIPRAEWERVPPGASAGNYVARATLNAVSPVRANSLIFVSLSTGGANEPINGARNLIVRIWRVADENGIPLTTVTGWQATGAVDFAAPPEWFSRFTSSDAATVTYGLSGTDVQIKQAGHYAFDVSVTA